MIRPLIALAVSVTIAAGTWLAIDARNDEATRTANDIQKQSLEYQREMQEVAKDAVEGTRSAEEVAAKSEAASKEMATDVIESVEADDNVPEEAKAQLEAAKAQLEQK